MRIFNIKKIGIIFLGVVFFLVIISGSFYAGMKFAQSKKVLAQVQMTSSQMAPPPILSHQTINKSFSFPLKDDKGQKVSDFLYVIPSAQLQNEIIINGQPAHAVKGKEFLVLNLKIVNNFNKGIMVNTRDYIRLSVNQNSERLAADVHNDPVHIQPSSTKYTRLGYTINTTDKNITFFVGEIDGKKQTVNLHF